MPTTMRETVMKERRPRDRQIEGNVTTREKIGMEPQWKVAGREGRETCVGSRPSRKLTLSMLTMIKKKQDYKSHEHIKSSEELNGRYITKK